MGLIFNREDSPKLRPFEGKIYRMKEIKFQNRGLYWKLIIEY